MHQSSPDRRNLLPAWGEHKTSSHDWYTNIIVKRGVCVTGQIIAAALDVPTMLNVMIGGVCWGYGVHPPVQLSLPLKGTLGVPHCDEWSDNAGTVKHLYL